jgi:cell division protein FtsN
MSNKQVVAIFVVGMALLLGAFWAGLFVVKQDTAPNANANSTSNQNQAAKPASEQEADSETSYVVGVGGSFGTQTQADQLMMELRRTYPSAYTQGPNSQNTLYRVHIGPYKKRVDAQQVANELSSQGRKGVMVYPWPPK